MFPKPKLFLVIFLFIVLADAFWLGLVMKDFYRLHLSSLSNNGLILWAGIGAWLLIAFGINFFVTTNAKKPKDALIPGAMLGLVIYGVYDLTNYAILKDWSLVLSIADVVWGIFLCSLASVLSTFLQKKLK